ncbi:MAG: tRNA(Ile)-lysidine synthase [Acidimicrobiaceae bacterium]
MSGGADSLALLALAIAAGCQATAVHVDHGLRAGSAAEADVVRVAAREVGAGFESRAVGVLPGPDLEARARAARASVLPRGALTGHTADDQAETMLLNLLRGAGLDGLRGIHPGSTKPLLRVRRAETVAVCAARGWVPVDDPSNRDPSIRRNRVRHELLPLLDDVGRRDVAAVLARQAALLGDDADLLDALAGALDPTDARELAAAPLPLGRRAVRAWLRSNGDAEQHPPDGATVERVLAVARGEAVGTDVGGGRHVRRSQGRLHLQVRSDP